ncbi:MAG: RNA polymerase sigma factor (sigma-70 family) [Planctomycetota bacterium]|jgi:RNA polymerase sigma factor (sigma-70 family)
MTNPTIEHLFRRYRDHHDAEALAQVYDRVAPQLIGLARRFQGPKSDGQDLLQETFLVALKKPESWDDSRPLLPWLLGILANRALKNLRKEARHLQNEPRSESESLDPAQVASASEFQSHLDSAIDTLPTTLAQTVRGSLIEGHSPSQLAIALGLAPGTVRQRLFRGMQSIRWQLRGWALALFAWFGFSWRPSSAGRRFLLEQAGKRAKDAGEIALVSTASKAIKPLAVLGLVAVVGGAALWKAGTDLGGQGDTSAGLQSPSGERESIRNSGNPSTEVTLNAAMRESIAAPGQGAQLAVWVQQGEANLPLANCEVELYSKIGGSDSRRRLRTDGTGRLVFSLAADEHTYSVTALPTPATAQARAFINREPQPGEVTILVHGGGSVSGQVLDESKRPVAGATVNAWAGTPDLLNPQRTFVTGPDGKFTLDHLGPNFVILAESPTQACVRGIHGTIDAGQKLAGHELWLEESKTLTGSVLLPDGSPAAGARVHQPWNLSSRSSYTATHSPGVHWVNGVHADQRTDRSGRFVLAGIPQTARYFTVELEPYLIHRPEGSPWKEGEVIQLRAGRAWAGQVRDVEGTAIVGAAVRYLCNARDKSTMSTQSVSDASGIFRFEGLVPRVDEDGNLSEACLAVHAPGFAARFVSDLPEWEPGRLPVDVVLQPEVVLKGRLVDGEGEGLGGRSIRIEGDRKNPTETYGGRLERYFSLGQTRSDAEGHFQFGGLWSGMFELTAHIDTKASVTLTEAAQSGGKPIKMVYRKEQGAEVKLFVRATDALTGEALSEYYVRRVSDGRGKPMPTEPWGDGYRVNGLVEGTYGIDVAPEGYVTHEVAPKTYTPGEHHLNVELLPERSLMVRVLEQDGTVITGGQVRGTDEFGNVLLFQSGHSKSSRLTYYQEIAHLHGLPACRVTLNFETNSGSQVLAIDLREPKDVVDLLLGNDVPIEGEVLFWVAPKGIDVRGIEQQLSGLSKEPTASDQDHWREVWTGIVQAGCRTPRFAFEAELKGSTGKRIASCAYAEVRDGSAGTDMAFESTKFKVSGSTGMSMTHSFEGPEELYPEPLSMVFASPPGACELKVESDNYAQVLDSWVPRSGPNGDLRVVILVPR